jgi:hypothetical protein
VNATPPDQFTPSPGAGSPITRIEPQGGRPGQSIRIYLSGFMPASSKIYFSCREAKVVDSGQIWMGIGAGSVPFVVVTIPQDAPHTSQVQTIASGVTSSPIPYIVNH